MGGKERDKASTDDAEAPPPADERARRLAEAMRANLRKRKAQQRAREDAAPRGPEERGDG